MLRATPLSKVIRNFSPLIRTTIAQLKPVLIGSTAGAIPGTMFAQSTVGVAEAALLCEAPLGRLTGPLSSDVPASLGTERRGRPLGGLALRCEGHGACAPRSISTRSERRQPGSANRLGKIESVSNPEYGLRLCRAGSPRGS